MPYPWDPGWEAGDLGKAVDRQALESLGSEETAGTIADAAIESQSLEGQIAALEKKRDELIELLDYLKTGTGAGEATTLIDSNEGFTRIKQKIDLYNAENKRIELEIRKDTDGRESFIEYIDQLKVEIQALNVDADPSDPFDEFMILFLTACKLKCMNLKSSTPSSTANSCGT